MSHLWTQAELQRHIDEQIEESLTLDYKSGEALHPDHRRNKEIAKDISAMANSAGGRIIYGIGEFNELEQRHLPEKLIPVDRTLISRETLEQIISSNIQPRISGIEIYPVPLDSNSTHVAYVVEIPQSDTVHQVTQSKRYYKRFNFESVPMEDYEIRDILNRESSPNLELFLGNIQRTETAHGRIWSLPIFVENTTHVAAKDTVVTVQFLNATRDNEIESDEFSIHVPMTPISERIYETGYPDAIHRGLTRWMGSFRVTTVEPQALHLRLQIFAARMRAKWWTLEVALDQNGTAVTPLEQGNLY